jgi:hypothetical protein
LNGTTWTTGAPAGELNNVKTIDDKTLAAINELDLMGLSTMG